MMKNFISHKHDSTKRGYTLLFSIMTAALVLGVAVFILSISRKQYILAATARDSMAAFYAADGGIGCTALAYNQGLISSTTLPDGTSSRITCYGVTVPIDPFGRGYGTSLPASGSLKEIYRSAPIVLHFGDIASANHQCAIVYITDARRNDVGHVGQPVIFIESFGYNLCDALGPDRSSHRTVERGLRLTEYPTY